MTRFEKMATMGSLATAGAAILISLYTLQLQIKDFEASRTLILEIKRPYRESTNDSEKNIITFSPIDPSVNIQRLDLIFSSDMMHERFRVLEVDPSTLTYDMSTLVLELPIGDAIISAPEGNRPGLKHPFWAMKSSVPVAINSTYISKGELISDASLYELHFSCYLMGQNGKDNWHKHTTFTGLSFVKGLGRNEEAAKNGVDEAFAGRTFEFR